MFIKKSIKNRVHCISLGCARNLVDSEVMLGILMQAGYVMEETLKKADIIIVNTCGFLEAARQEACDTISAVFKEKKKDAKVIVAGCAVQKYGEAIRPLFPDVHYFLGSGEMEKILEAVEAEEKGEAITSAKSYLENGEVPRLVSTPKHYAYLKIAEGCKKHCSFCIIPNIKGKLQSKPVEKILQELHLLLKRGVKEIILIAQDLGDYGKDRIGELPSLEGLLQAMLKSTQEKFWLRLLYLYPDEISDSLITLISQDSRICPYLDMPLQHINNRILKRMRRKTSREEIIATITKLREKIPSIVIRTSLMVGFPGETEEEFEELVQFIQDYPLDNVGIFSYSREEESHSATLDGHIPEEVKQARFQRLSQVQKEVAKKHNEKYVGQTLEVMVEGYHPETNLLLRGRFYGQCPEIDGQVLLNDFTHVKEFGKLYKVEITQALSYDLVGHVLKEEKKKEKKKVGSLCVLPS